MSPDAHQVCAGLTFTFVYLDDVLVSSPDGPSHIQLLRLNLQWFKEYAVVINLNKCEFGLSEISLHGHKVTSSGISPLQKHAQGVQEYPRPSSHLEILRFLGLINFYRRFISGAARILKSLTDSIAATSRSFQWTAEIDSAFHQDKSALATASLLVHPIPSANLAIAVDASATHVGAVLQQFEDSLGSCGLFQQEIIRFGDALFYVRPRTARRFSRYLNLLTNLYIKISRQGSCRAGVDKVRPAGQIRPMSFVDPAHGQM